MKNLFRIYLAVIVFTGVAFSCAEDDPGAEVVLQDVIATYNDCTCDPYINEYLWENKTVFVTLFKGPACNWTPAYYDEKGSEMEFDEGFTWEQFTAESTFVRTVWTCGE